MTITATTPPAVELDVLVIGAGQAGLALAHDLARRDLRFLVVDAAPRIGEVWRNRWDSLRLFTPAEYDALPGTPFPAPAGSHPGKDDVAAYLETYARSHALPVRLNTPVLHLTPVNGGYTAQVPDGSIFSRQVVVATGPFQTPYIPGLAAGLDAAVVQVHSDAYSRPEDVPAGSVLVVGAGNSGLQIAAELAAAGRSVTVAMGSRPRTVPQTLLRRDLFWWLTTLGLISTPADTRLARRLRRRELVIGTSWRGLQAHGITVRPRAVDAAGRSVQLADGTAVPVDAVVWATGYRPEHSWLDVPGVIQDGEVRHRRGVTSAPGLVFLGLAWQHTRGSALLGFVHDDAAWIDAHLAELRPTPRTDRRRRLTAPAAGARP